jgi:hypothetical protein
MAVSATLYEEIETRTLVDTLDMDPLSTLSLASNIVQFVDFSCRLISETRKVYNSATGLPDDAMCVYELLIRYSGEHPQHGRTD